MEQRQPLPPFSMETALQKVQMAEDAWNSKDPEKVSLAYSVNTECATGQNSLTDGKQ